MTSTVDAAEQKRAVCELRPVNLNSHDEYQRLQSQRRECGWYHEDVYLNRWREAAHLGTKCLFWIIKSSQASSQSTAFAGHISLDSISEYEDPQHELARPDKSLLTVSTFFVLPEFQAKGIGGQAMAQIERLARLEPYGHPRCTAIAIMSLSCQYVEDPVCRARYVEWTGEEPVSYERWYAKMGYVKWKEEACTKVVKQDREVVFLVEAFMKKTLSGVKGPGK